jgi:hypothetical protein
MFIKLSWPGFLVNPGAAGDMLRQTLGIAAGNRHLWLVFSLAPFGFGLGYAIHNNEP